MDIEIEDTIRIDVSTLIDIDYVTDFSGRKTSEGDGRTAADIEREMAEAEETH